MQQSVRKPRYSQYGVDGESKSLLGILKQYLANYVKCRSRQGSSSPIPHLHPLVTSYNKVAADTFFYVPDPDTKIKYN